MGRTESEAAEAKLERILKQRHGKVTIIPVRGCQGFLIVRTTPDAAADLRESLATLEIEGEKVVSLMTSGCISKLKRLANRRAASVDAKVSERGILQEPGDSTSE